MFEFFLGIMLGGFGTILFVFMTSVDINDDDKTFENEQSTVTIPLKEYDKLREKQKYITDKDMISVVDKIEELVRALRKHIVRTEV